MANFTQVESTLLAHQLITHAADGVTVVGAPVDVSSAIAATVQVYHANVEVTANATGIHYSIEGSTSTTGDESWSELILFISSEVAAVTEDLDAAEPVAETVIAVTVTTDFEPRDIIYIDDVTAVADGEWHRIASEVSNVSFTLMDGLTNAKAIGDDIYGPAEIFTAQLNLAGIQRVRAVAQHLAVTGSNVHLKALMTTVTDLV